MKKLFNRIKELFQIHKDLKEEEEINLRIGMSFYNLSNDKCYITHILENQTPIQVVFKYYFKTTKTWLYRIESLREMNSWISDGDYKICK